MFLLFILTATAIGATVEANTLNVSVYYESLCPDSMRFITTQLYPSWELISDYLNVEFVPYGNADITENDDGSLEFSCQHGPLECYGNEIQACAVHIGNQSSVVEFVNCAMSDDASDDALLEKCSEISGISWEAIEQCMDSGLAEELFVKEGQITDAVTPPIAYVPTVIFNGVYDATLQDMGENHFLTTACQLLEQEPSNCVPIS